MIILVKYKIGYNIQFDFHSFAMRRLPCHTGIAYLLISSRVLLTLEGRYKRESCVYFLRCGLLLGLTLFSISKAYY